MEVMPPEIRILVIAWNPETGEVIEVTRVSRDELTNDNLEMAISEALDKAVEVLGPEEIAQWTPQLDVWLWSERGMRASMHLSRELIRKIAKANASLDYDPYTCGPATS